MARFNRGGFTRRPSSGVAVRRKTLWSRTSFIESVITTASTPVILFTFTTAFLDAHVPFTIVRSRGVITLASDQSAANETQQVAFACAIVSEQAIAIGVTAVPTPTTDLDSDMFFVYETLNMQTSAAGSPGNFMIATVERRIDSKAMRKVEDGEGLVGVIETGAQSQGVEVTVAMSFLLKLH